MFTEETTTAARLSRFDTGTAASTDGFGFGYFPPSFDIGLKNRGPDCGLGFVKLGRGYLPAALHQARQAETLATARQPVRIRRPRPSRAERRRCGRGRR